MAQSNQVPDTPVAWFLLLARAMDDGRLADAARYRDRLARHGVFVTWRVRPRRQTKPEGRP